MRLNRRGFVAATAAMPFAALPLAVMPLAALAASRPASRSRTATPASSALAAIRAEAERHRAALGVPGLTLGLIAPGMTPQTIMVGTTDAAGHARVGPDTLFQVGSISKLMTAAVIHQLAAEGRLDLAGDARALLPGVGWPDGAAISVQQLLDHVSGLPGDAPVFPADGPLWRGSDPGSHWFYSNTGYDLLGLIAARAGGASLARLLHQRLFAPLGMAHSRGAIVVADRARYAQGYEPVDPDRPYLHRDPLAPAPWVDFYGGAGCVASTAADMALLLASLAAAAAGRGGLGLDVAAASAFATHAVDSGGGGHGVVGAMRYGNGLMHVADPAGRLYLHHTGGMASFTSSFHLDPLTGIGAFASTPMSAAPGYRPRALTLFAVQALAAAHGAGAAPNPADFTPVRVKPAGLVGRYVGPKATVMLSADDGVSLAVEQAPRSDAGDPRRGVLVPLADNLVGVRLAGWQDYPLGVVRRDGQAVALTHGGDTYVRDGARYAAPASDPALARLAGHYGSDVPFLQNLRIVERGGGLLLGGIDPLVRIADNLYRVGAERWSPERIRFADMVDGRPMTIYASGARLERRDA